MRHNMNYVWSLPLVPDTITLGIARVDKSTLCSNETTLSDLLDGFRVGASSSEKFQL